jgi:hypothetical protein
MKTPDITISAIAFQESDGWVAQCLQYDIAVQAKTLPELQYELQRVLVSHIVISEESGQEPFAGLRPAPGKFWEMYERAKTRVERDDMPFRLPKPTASHIASILKIAEQSSVAC